MDIQFSKGKFGNLTAVKSNKKRVDTNVKNIVNKKIEKTKIDSAALKPNQGVHFDSNNTKSISNEKLQKFIEEKVKITPEELNKLTKDTGNVKTKSESFNDVKDEMDKNVPDQTTTIEEKEKALEYIDRMLACEDISPEMKTYWTNKKNVIEMEIQNIKNFQQIGNDENWEDVAKEIDAFRQKYFENISQNGKEDFEKLDFADKHEFNKTLTQTMLSYCERILNCQNVPNEVREYYLNVKSEMIVELNLQSASLNENKKANNEKTESFNSVFEEMRRNIPDSTTTVNEKREAISYIKRMLSCDDISPEMKTYWQNKMNIIEMEIQNIENTKQTGHDENWEDVVKELEAFSQQYWTEGISNARAGLDELNDSDKQEYLQTVKNTMTSYCERILNCENVPNEVRKYYSDVIMELAA